MTVMSDLDACCQIQWIVFWTYWTYFLSKGQFSKNAIFNHFFGLLGKFVRKKGINLKIRNLCFFIKALRNTLRVVPSKSVRNWGRWTNLEKLILYSFYHLISEEMAWRGCRMLFFWFFFPFSLVIFSVDKMVWVTTSRSP